MEKPYHKKKSEIYIEETTSLTERIQSEVPPSGKYSLNLKRDLNNKKDKLENWEIPKEYFKDLPLSKKNNKRINRIKIL